MLTERSHATELMDDPALPESTFREVLKDLARVNRVTLAHRPTLRFLRRALRGRDSFALLDVGFGDGDMLRAIARWAQKRGLRAELTGIDLNANSKAVAEAKPSALPIRYMTGDYARLTGRRFDCIISCLVAHHMSRGELVAFLRFMEAEARVGWFVNDLHRLAISYLSYPWLARLMRVHRIVREDGRTSIARSFRPAEWSDLLLSAGIASAHVERRFPFRLCVEQLREWPR